MKKQFHSYEKMRVKASVPTYRGVEYACVGLEDTSFYTIFSPFHLFHSFLGFP